MMIRVTTALLLLLSGCSIPLEGGRVGRVETGVASERAPETRSDPVAGRPLQPGDATAPGGTGGLSDSTIPGSSAGTPVAP